jgi:hypothetical protein
MWVLVDWSQEAKEYSVGKDFLKKIYIMWDNYLIKTENYSKPKIIDLKKDGIAVIDRTLGQRIPKESSFVPKVSEILGKLQISKIVR